MTDDDDVEPSEPIWKRRGCLNLVIGVVVLVGFAWGLIEFSTNGAASNPIAVATPPPGRVWFGASYDPTTFALTGRTSSVNVGMPVSGVAHLTRLMDGSGLALRVDDNGQPVSNVAIGASGTGDLLGFSAPAPTTPGTWTYALVDRAGTVLATGDLIVAALSTSA
jgi:hypothetical protein